MNRSLIVSGSLRESEKLVRILKTLDNGRCTMISSGSEARRMISGGSCFELVLINTPLPDEFGQELSIMISDFSAADIILVCSNDISDAVIEKVSDHGICVLRKPVSRDKLRDSLESVRAARARMLGLRKENVSLLSKIDDMRLINRAKCTLMQYLKFTEPQAHRYIEKQAMNTRRTRREVAEKILLSYER